MEDIENIINVNDMSTLKLTRLLLPSMIQRKSGWILNVTSLAAFIAGPGHCMYIDTINQHANTSGRYIDTNTLSSYIVSVYSCVSCQ